jgi:hypothetical protein
LSSVFLENLKSRHISPEANHDINFPAHKRPTMNLTFLAYLTPPPLYYHSSRGGSRFWGLEAYKILGAACKKHNKKLQIQNYVRTCIFIYKEKKISRQITNFKKADKFHKHHKIQKNNIIISLINCLTDLNNP